MAGIVFLLALLQAPAGDGLGEPGRVAPPIVVELELSIEEFDPSHPDGSLRGIVHNRSNRKWLVPGGLHAETASVHARPVRDDEGRARGLRLWPATPSTLRLQRREASAIDPALAALPPGRSLVLFELPLEEILLGRRSGFVEAPSRPGTGGDSPGATHARHASAWTWGWKRHPYPPASPIHGDGGSWTAAVFGLELQVEDEALRSNTVLLQVREDGASSGDGRSGAVAQDAVADMRWRTTGGGQISFDVTRDGEGFLFHVTEKDFREIDATRRLLPGPDEAYRLLEAIFDGTLEVRDETFEPRGSSGSWTTITLIDSEGEELVVPNVRAWGRLGVVADFAAGATTAGGPSEGGGPVEHHSPMAPVALLKWRTTGGGNIAFDVTRDGEDFVFHLTERDFGEVDATRRLSPGSDDEAYGLLEAIFDGKLDLRTETFEPKGATGSWTTITLVDLQGEELVVPDIRAWGRLGVVSAFAAGATADD